MNAAFWDKWGLPAAAVVIGLIILWGIFLAPGREDEAAKKGGGAASAKQ